MLKIAICDDEEIFGKHIEKLVTEYLEQRGELYSMERFSSGREFVELGTQLAGFQIVFLDIEMSELNGLETAGRIREFSDEVYIVFVTAFMNYTLEGYKVNAFRYLLKNVDHFQDALEECLDSIFRKMKIVPRVKRYHFAEGEKQFFLKRLMYIESNLHTLKFYILEDDLEVYTMHKTLNFIERDMDESLFLRIHQSYLVNLAFVEELADKTVVLVDGTRLPVAKLRYKDVMQRYISFRGVR